MQMLNAVLFGNGGIGRHHLRLLRQNAQVQLCGVIDPANIAVENVKVWKSAEEFWHDVSVGKAPRPDLAFIATPIHTHFAIAQSLLQQGLHVFVEKPIAPNYEQAIQLTQLANHSGKILYVGHSERHNPAFHVFLREFKRGITGQAYRIECNRTGPFPQKQGDFGATIDLAVHDLDALSVVFDNAAPEWVFASTEQRIHATHEDGLNAMLGYAPDVVVQMTVNWLSPRKARYLNVFGHSGMLQCDYYLQTVTFFENLYRRNKPDEYGIGGIEVGATQSFDVPQWEPLAHEHEDFLQKVAQGQSAQQQQALTSACLAVEIANRLIESAQGHCRLEFKK